MLSVDPSLLVYLGPEAAASSVPTSYSPKGSLASGMRSAALSIIWLNPNSSPYLNSEAATAAAAFSSLSEHHYPLPIYQETEVEKEEEDVLAPIEELGPPRSKRIFDAAVSRKSSADGPVHAVRRPFGW
jgi:hypothetical protein